MKKAITILVLFIIVFTIPNFVNAEHYCYYGHDLYDTYTNWCWVKFQCQDMCSVQIRCHNCDYCETIGFEYREHHEKGSFYTSVGVFEDDHNGSTHTCRIKSSYRCARSGCDKLIDEMSAPTHESHNYHRRPEPPIYVYSVNLKKTKVFCACGAWKWEYGPIDPKKPWYYR